MYSPLPFITTVSAVHMRKTSFLKAALHLSSGRANRAFRNEDNVQGDRIIGSKKGLSSQSFLCCY